VRDSATAHPELMRHASFTDSTETVQPSLCISYANMRTADKSLTSRPFLAKFYRSFSHIQHFIFDSSFAHHSEEFCSQYGKKVFDPIVKGLGSSGYVM
jgi:hypothetical protein